MSKAATILLFCLLTALVARGAFAISPSPVTTYRQMAARLQADTAQSGGWLHTTQIGLSAHGRPLWLVKAADPQSKSPDAVRILVLCRQHGDEPASTEALLGLLHHVAMGQEPGLRASLQNVSLYVVPMVNPDGADAGTRHNAAHADLNRDWGPFTQPETRAVRDAARLLQPQIVLDAHNWDNSDEYNLDCVEVSRAMLTPMGRLTHAVQQDAVQDLKTQGYEVHPTAFGPEAVPDLAHRWFSAQGVLSLLVETHSGDPHDAADFMRRQGMYTELVKNLAARFTEERQRLALARVEPDISPSREAELFTASVPQRAANAAVQITPEPKAAFLWPLGAFLLALWGAGLCRLTSLASGTHTGKGRKRQTLPASAARSAARHGTPRYRCSQSVPVFRPAPAACVRKR